VQRQHAKLVTLRLQVRLQAGALPADNLGQVVHTHVLLFTAVQFGTGQRAVMLCSWEGNHMSGVALGIRHGLSGLSTFRLNGHRKGDEHPAYTPDRVWHLYLYLTY